MLEGKISRLEARLRDLESNGRQRTNSDVLSSALSSYPASSSTSTTSSLRPQTRSGVASPEFESSDTVTLQQYSLWTSSSSSSVYSAGFTPPSPSPSSSPEVFGFSWFIPVPSFTQEPGAITEDETNKLYVLRVDPHLSHPRR